MNKEKKIEEIASSFHRIMCLLGLDINSPSMLDTPNRVAKMYVNEFCAGLDSANAPTITTFPNDGNYDQILLVKDIAFSSICEHHFVPFMGKVHIAYMPGNNIVGLSKFARTVQHLAAKPQVQERLTQEIAKTLEKALRNKNIAVVVIAKHLCCSIRGAKDINSYTTTSYLGGLFRKDAAIKKEFFDLIKLSNP